jgi:hypothetical protein
VDRFRSLNQLRPGQAALLAVVLASLAGCSSGMGEVTGTVRYNGKPLPFGTIQFLGQDGIPCSSQIQPDGTFCALVPVGEAKVIVSCLDETRLNRMHGQLAAGRGRVAPPALASGNFSLIPRRYTDWDASGLTVRVERGKRTQDLSLTSP